MKVTYSIHEIRYALLWVTRKHQYLHDLISEFIDELEDEEELEEFISDMYADLHEHSDIVMKTIHPITLQMWVDQVYYFLEYVFKHFLSDGTTEEEEE